MRYLLDAFDDGVLGGQGELLDVLNDFFLGRALYGAA